MRIFYDTWSLEPGHFMLMPQLKPLHVPPLATGDAFAEPLFPQVWPRASSADVDQKQPVHVSQLGGKPIQ